MICSAATVLSFPVMLDQQMSRNGKLHRPTVSLFTATTFVVMSVTGLIAFIQPFSIGIVGLHSLMGFVFIALIGLHASNNFRSLARYLRGRIAWLALAGTSLLTLLFWWQPPPVYTVLRWSGNLGPALERFKMSEDEMVFDYHPSPDYQLRLTVRTGPTYDVGAPPHVAIWLENQGGYHIKTLLAPDPAGHDQLPYWAFKHAGWVRAKRDAEQASQVVPSTDSERISEIDGISSATPNGSFDPADYILPRSTTPATPYSLLLEVNQPGDDQPSLVHIVEIDNSLPRTFQLLELRGYPKRDGDLEQTGQEVWSLYYIDQTFTTSLDLIDSVLLTIKRPT